MEKIRIFKSVLLGTLIVVCICGCGRSTAKYVVADEVQVVETESETAESEEATETNEREILLYIYVCGEVKSPGVYTLPEGSRVCDAFSMAGGFTEDAAIDYWNQARLLKDGEMIYVPTIEEAMEREGDVASDAEISQEDTTGKININTASKTQLMTIPGIGEAKASAIIKYREENGLFSSIEDVKKVEGIKDGVFTKMKEYILID